MTATIDAPLQQRSTDVPELLKAPGVTRLAVDELSRLCDDTPWMRERRMMAWEAYERIPMPTSRDEHWRFTNMRRVDVTGVPTFSRPPTLQLPEFRQLPDGAVFCPLERAMREHADLVQRHFGTAVPVGDSVDDKFVALQQATLANGVFVYIPRNVRVELPLRADVVHAAAGGHVNWRALVVAEEGAAVEFVEQFSSTADELTGFSNAVVEVIAGKGSHVRYVTLQRYATPVTHFATHRVLAHRDAQVEWVAVGLGASLGKTRMEVRMLGPGSNVRITGAYFLDGRQELDYDTQQFHEAPNAVSDLSFRGALAGKARSVWRGMIDVAEGAQGTDAYQENRNLLLTTGAHADSVPGLQIEANEVRCTHAATISKVDSEQLFYLMSRGLPRDEATRTIVRGFFVPVLDRISDQVVRDSVRDLLHERMDRATAGSL